MNKASIFNEAFPIGSPFLYEPVKGAGEWEPVTTRSVAWTLGSGEAVVLVTGRTGGVSLSHLEPADDATMQAREQEHG